MTTTKHTKEQEQTILNEVANGSSVRAAAKAVGVDEHTVWCWQESRADFRQRLEAARVERLHRLEDSIFYLMEELDAAAGDEKATAKIQAIRVKLEVAKWVLSKMLPRYSDNPRNVSLAEAILAQLKTPDLLHRSARWRAHARESHPPPRLACRCPGLTKTPRPAVRWPLIPRRTALTYPPAPSTRPAAETPATATQGRRTRRTPPAR